MWQLLDKTARWTSARLVASVQLDQPRAGIEVESVCGVPVDSTLLMQLHIGPGEDPGGEPIGDCHARGADLVVTYQATHDRPVLSQICWRLVDEPDLGEAIVLDAVFSIETQLLDSDPRMRICCQLPGTAWSRLQGQGAATPLDCSAAHVSKLWEIDAAPNGDALLFRYPETLWSYGHIIHPAGFVSAQLVVNPQDASSRLCTSYFDGRLEKGVICRGQARGILAPQDCDQELIATHYVKLLREPPPLAL